MRRNRVTCMTQGQGNISTRGVCVIESSIKVWFVPWNKELIWKNKQTRCGDSFWTFGKCDNKFTQAVECKTKWQIILLTLRFLYIKGNLFILKQTTKVKKEADCLGLKRLG